MAQSTVHSCHRGLSDHIMALGHRATCTMLLFLLFAMNKNFPCSDTLNFTVFLLHRAVANPSKFLVCLNISFGVLLFLGIPYEWHWDTNTGVSDCRIYVLFRTPLCYRKVLFLLFLCSSQDKNHIV